MSTGAPKSSRSRSSHRDAPTHSRRPPRREPRFATNPRQPQELSAPRSGSPRPRPQDANRRVDHPPIVNRLAASLQLVTGQTGPERGPTGATHASARSRPVRRSGLGHRLESAAPGPCAGVPEAIGSGRSASRFSIWSERGCRGRRGCRRCGGESSSPAAAAVDGPRVGAAGHEASTSSRSVRARSASSEGVGARPSRCDISAVALPSRR